jgi:uncharacterized protein DUF3828
MVRLIAIVGCAAALVLEGCGPGGGRAPAQGSAKPPSSSDAADAAAFLEGLYAHYRTSQGDSFSMFDTNAREVFDPTVLALLAADRKATKDEPGALDGDWLCDCQDFVSLRATIAVRSATPHDASASAEVRDVGMPSEAPRHIEFQLVKTASGWRIHDIRTADQPWLTQALTGEIKDPKSADGD